MKKTIVGVVALAAVAVAGQVAAQEEDQSAAAAEAGAGDAEEAVDVAADFDAAAPAEEPMVLPAQQRSQGNAVLPANTEVLLRMNQTVTTKGKTWKEGDTFNLTVVNNVMLGNYVVIPEGSKGVGRITWMTNKGAFGKSGKLDVELEYVEVAGRKILVDGTYRQEGEGNTIATVGGVVAAGPFAAFITGKSGVIPQGRELLATTEKDLPLAVAASEVDMEPAPVAGIAGAAAGATAQADAEMPDESDAETAEVAVVEAVE